MSTNTTYPNEYTAEQKKLADEIVALEKAALDKWFNGDSSGYRLLWSQKSFSYFDSMMDHRVDSYAEIAAFVQSAVDGKLYADCYDFLLPRVQFSADNSMGVLTFQLHSNTSLLNMHYNCIEMYCREGASWQVVHSTWSFIQPLSNNFGTVSEVA